VDGPPRLTLFAVPDEVGPPVAEVVAQLSSLSLPGQVEVAPCPDGRTALDCMIGSASPLVGVVRAGDLVEPESVDRRLDALLSYPAAVMAVAPAGSSSTDQGLEDGRRFARRLLLGGAGAPPTPSVTLFRRAAISVGDGLPARPPAKGTGPAGEQAASGGVDWYVWLVLRLAVRGAVWLDSAPGVTTPEPSLSARLLQWRQWPDVIAVGADLGLIDDHDVRVPALVEHTRRAAGLLEAMGRPAVPTVPPEQRLESVDELVAYWRVLDRRAASIPEPLPLDVLVRLVDPNRPMASELKDLSRQVRQVTVVGPPEARPAAPPAGVIWEPTGITGEVADQAPGVGEPDGTGTVAVLARASDRPTLLLDAGEVLEIRDAAQATALLTAGVDRVVDGQDGDVGAGSYELTTPAGLQPRLFRPGTGSAPRPIHSIRVAASTDDPDRDWMPEPEVEAVGMLRRFVIAAPDYTEIHGGVVALHRLCDRLNAVGCEAFIEPLGEAIGITHPHWRSPLWRGRNLDDAVVVYPEIVTGNPLGARRVVRWLLNRPAWFTGSPMDEHPDDLVITFDQQIAPGYHELRLPLIDPNRFFPKDVPGRGALLWIGKGELPADFDRSETTLVTGTWPAPRAQLAARLRSADVLYTCDWLTSVIGEALMCGTPVVLVGDQVWSRDEIVMFPGMAWGADRLDAAREEVDLFFPDYLESLRWVGRNVADFVNVVNDHFARVG
jgi:hypothetical protein